jgi:hypothetical protein
MAAASYRRRFLKGSIIFLERRRPASDQPCLEIPRSTRMNRATPKVASGISENLAARCVHMKTFKKPIRDTEGTETLAKQIIRSEAKVQQ